MSDSRISRRNNVKVAGSGTRVLMFAHGFGCDQNMWRLLTDLLQHDYRLVTFDYVGSGQSDLAAFSVRRYATLEGYASDIVDVIHAHELTDVTLVGHSVSAVTSMLAAIQAPGRITGLVMVCPSPCYLNDPPDYMGGFERGDLEELIDMMDKNYIGWAHHLAPLVMGTHADDALTGAKLTAELASSFCSTDPLVAKTFARATFFSDYRDVLPSCPVPTLVLQSRHDALAAVSVGEYVAGRLPRSVLKVLDTRGHCIHMTDPGLTAAEIRAFAPA